MSFDERGHLDGLRVMNDHPLHELNISLSDRRKFRPRV
jgi:hypothetical protein